MWFLNTIRWALPGSDEIIGTWKLCTMQFIYLSKKSGYPNSGNICCVQRNREKSQFMTILPYVEPAALVFGHRTIKPYITHTHAGSMQIDTVFVWTKTHSRTVCSREIVNSFHGHSGIHTHGTHENLENKKKDNAQRKKNRFYFWMKKRQKPEKS